MQVAELKAEPEVDHLDVAGVVKENVLALQIAKHNPYLQMQILQHPQKLREGAAPVPHSGNGLCECTLTCPKSHCRKRETAFIHDDLPPSETFRCEFLGTISTNQ
jgi:hypothetical protein